LRAGPNEELPVDSNCGVDGNYLMIVIMKLELLVALEMGREHLLNTRVLYTHKRDGWRFSKSDNNLLTFGDGVNVSSMKCSLTFQQMSCFKSFIFVDEFTNFELFCEMLRSGDE
jgi:hypothetical protein